MKKGLLVSTAMGLLLAGGLARAQSQSTDDQNTDDTWDGPGYYFEDYATYPTISPALWKDGGPFASLEACQDYWRQNPPPAAKPDQQWTDSYQCVYRGNSVNYAALPCFLTTACVEHAGLPDDCEELTVMRAFRDSYLNRFEEGRLLIDQYYRIAPRIVEHIRRASDRRRVLDWVLHEVRATAKAIGRGESEAAIARYAAMVLRLQQRYGERRIG
jgi:hypothetical protein